MKSNSIQRKNSWMQDPRYKHEYLDRYPKIPKRSSKDDDESDKHLEARDRRYSCLISKKLSNSKVDIQKLNGSFINKH